MTNKFYTKEEIANNLNERNVYEAEILEVRPSTILFKVVDSDAKALAHIKDISVVRLSDLREVFQPGEIWPIVIKDCTAEEMDGYTRIRMTAAMNPIFGNREHVMKQMGSLPMQLPICENKVDYNLCIALSPNYTALIEDNKRFNNKESVLASIAFISERGKFRLNIHEEAVECCKTKNELMKELFNLYKIDISNLPTYIDIQAFRNQQIGLLPGNDNHTPCVKPDPELSILEPENCRVYPQHSMLRATEFDTFIREIACNAKILKILDVADKLFYYFTAEQLFNICNDKAINHIFMNKMKSFELFSHTKITSANGKANVYTTAKNARHLSMRVMPLRDQVTTDANWLLRHLSINKILLKLYKTDNTIINTVARNHFFVSGNEKFRALALIEKDKLIVDSIRSENDIETMLSKLIRMDAVFNALNDKYTVYITARTEFIENALRSHLENIVFSNIIIKTTNDISFENDMVINEVETKISPKKASFWGKVNSLIATF